MSEPAETLGKWTMPIEGGTIESDPVSGVWRMRSSQDDVTVTAEVSGLPGGGDPLTPVDPDVRHLDTLIAFLTQVRDGKSAAGKSERSELVDAVVAELADATDEQVRTVLLMTEMLKCGDMSVDFVQGVGGETAGSVH